MHLIQARGFSLVELMIAMVIGLIVATIALLMYVAIIKANSTSIQSARLTQALQASLDVMERDIRRAGYLAPSSASSAIDTNYVTRYQTDAQFSLYTSAATPALQDLHPSASNFSCLLLRYDANDNGSIGGADEILGYRFNSTDQTIEMKSWATLAGQRSELCADNGWEAMTGDGSTRITALTFTITPSSGVDTDSGQRSINIDIRGASRLSSALQMRLQRQVRLRNDQP